jgi:hypothetical protein
MEVSLQAGRVVGERWRLRSRLGDEGTSRFWEAEDLRTGSRVAVEFACVELPDPEAKSRFFRETRAWVELRSPLIVHTLDRGLAGEGLAFAVTEFLRGEDLGRMLARESALGWADAVQILDQVCRAISRLHAAKLGCEQRLEPKYVFVVDRSDHSANTPVIKLLNAGLGAESQRERTPSGWQYVSPESVAPARAARTVPSLTQAAQVWALGVLGCRMLTGALPFDADSRGTLADDWGARFTRLRETRAELPAELDEWFRTAIHPDPGRRFATVEQAGLALGHIATTYASSVALAPARPRPTMDDASPKPTRLPTRPERARPDPQRVSVAPERERRAGGPTRGRSAVIEVDRTPALRDGPVAHQYSPVSIAIEIENGAASAVGQAPAASADVHDRETLASRVHAAAAKRRKKVAAAERSASLRRAASVGVVNELPPPPAASLTRRLGWVHELAPIVVREQATLTPADEDSFGARAVAAITSATGALSHRSADRDLAPFARSERSDSAAAERARMLRIERARWRASAVLAVMLGLFGGFLLRSIVSMKLPKLELASDGAAIEEGIPAHAILVEAQQKPVAAAIEVPKPAEVAAPVELPVTSPRIATNVRPSAASTSPLKRSLITTASRKPPVLDMPTETPPSVASRAALLAAPPPVDTTPLQVYRGF